MSEEKFYFDPVYKNLVKDDGVWFFVYEKGNWGSQSILRRHSHGGIVGVISLHEKELRNSLKNMKVVKMSLVG